MLISWWRHSDQHVYVRSSISFTCAMFIRLLCMGVWIINTWMGLMILTHFFQFCRNRCVSAVLFWFVSAGYVSYLGNSCSLLFLNYGRLSINQSIEVINLLLFILEDWVIFFSWEFKYWRWCSLQIYCGLWVWADVSGFWSAGGMLFNDSKAYQLPSIFSPLRELLSGSRQYHG